MVFQRVSHSNHPKKSDFHQDRHPRGLGQKGVARVGTAWIDVNFVDLKHQTINPKPKDNLIIYG